MSVDDVLLEAEEGMEKAVDFMVHEFSAIRTGKASPALVENLDVEAYGTLMKLKQVAVISAPEPRLLVIQPFDASTVKKIEKAIIESKLGVMPAVDGRIIRIGIPELSEDRRRDLARVVKHLAEEGRVRVRGCRREAMDAVKKMRKDGDLTEDDLESAEDEIQDLTDKYIGGIEKQLAAKEAELMRI